MYIKENVVLVKDDNLFTGFFVMTKDTRSFVIFENDDDAKITINNLVLDGAEEYNNIESFFISFPLLSYEQQLANAKAFLKPQNEDISQQVIISEEHLH